jgi:TonB family protein
MRTIWISIRLVALLAAVTIVAAGQTPAPVRVAVLDFGDSATGSRAAEKVREGLLADRLAAASGLVLIDRNLAIAAARGAGFQGSLNLTTPEARDIGAAIGCDFFIIGDADTVRRSPSTGAAYFESYAAIFIVSARTGQLISWRRPGERRDTADEAEKALLQNVSDGNRVAILRAAEDERSERAAAVDNPAAAIEVMSDEDGAKSDTRAPRPYRRVKPPYPESAGQAEVEATVDVLVDVDARGEISHLEIARWAGYGLDQSVIDTVKQIHFFPAMRDGVAIPMRVLLRYNFHRTPTK